MPYRQIKGLLWARPYEGVPKFATEARGRPNRQGVAYERRVVAMLRGGTAGQWFQYQDERGLGWCQPDLFTADVERLVVIECKLTWTSEAREQITHLYCPILEHIYGKPVVGVIVAKNLTAATPRERVVWDMPAALALATRRTPAVLHWRPR